MSYSEGINLGNNEIIGEVSNDGYKYRGIAEKDGICHEKVKESTRKEYLKRLTSLCKSKLMFLRICFKQSTHGQSLY